MIDLTISLSFRAIRHLAESRGIFLPTKLWREGRSLHARFALGRDDISNRLFNFTLALFLLLFSLPLLFILYLIVKLTSKGPFIYKQIRIGKDKKPFILYKIRTMVQEADKLKNKYLKLNEADGPVFKIRNDPRYTKVGRHVARFGLDELPQLINVLKGEMALVGPRPFPIDEALKIPKKYSQRFSVLPGMTSPWVVKGAHQLSFDKWMELDLEYIENRSIWFDIKILLVTIKTILLSII